MQEVGSDFIVPVKSTHVDCRRLANATVFFSGMWKHLDTAPPNISLCVEVLGNGRQNATFPRCANAPAVVDGDSATP